MNEPDVDAVLNYLSIKFNKIFCDREFVSSVISDFQTIFKHKTRCCVLVFPTLGPTYLKALRHQARIFDLAVFSVNSASGKFRSLAVCHKDHLLLVKSSCSQDQVPAPEMSSSSSRKKRPERQLYVPPAQRRSRLHPEPRNKLEHNNNECETQQPSSAPCNSNPQCVSKPPEIVYLRLRLLYDVFYFIDVAQNLPSVHKNCEFAKYLYFKTSMCDQYDFELSLMPCLDVTYLSRCRLCLPHIQPHLTSFPIFNFDKTSSDLQDLYIFKPMPILVRDFDSNITQFMDELDQTLAHRISCDPPKNTLEYQHLDLSIINFGHFIVVPHSNQEYIYECEKSHDAESCYTLIKAEISRKECEKIEEVAMKNGQNIIQPKAIEKKCSKNDENEHEQEKEIMRKTKQHINRRTRPIMKYVDDENDDMLKIDKNDSVNNWEDLLDETGEIQEDLLTEIVGKVGDGVTIVTASEDYSAYTSKPPEDLEHVVELYNFPSSLETHDLVQAFSTINSDAMYIKWVDDTHALLVLGSLSQAQKAVAMNNPLIKVRPMTAASSLSIDVANKSDLKPAMKRPETNLQTARRLITSHLGAKSKVTKEQMDKERQDLKLAREKKRLFKQSEKDAWEGKIRSSVN